MNGNWEKHRQLVHVLVLLKQEINFPSFLSLTKCLKESTCKDKSHCDIFLEV